MKPPEAYRKVAVIGGGFIGFSFGALFARGGLETFVYNRRSRTFDSILPRIREALEFLAAEGLMDAAEVDPALARVTVTDDLASALYGCDYVQECLWEDLELKRRIFREISDRTAADVPIGSSCSGLRISDISCDVVNAKERCIVAHPTNPPHLIPFMEISGDAASQEVKDSVCALFTRLGQKPVQCREVYGYVLNRIQLSLIQEALYLVREGICSVQAVECALTEGLGLRWAFTGPYGVEELNSASLGEGLWKYKDYMLEFFTKEQQRVLDYDQAFVERAVEGFAPVLDGRTHEEYLAWRNRMVAGARRLKLQDPR